MNQILLSDETLQEISSLANQLNLSLGASHFCNEHKYLVEK